MHDKLLRALGPTGRTHLRAFNASLQFIKRKNDAHSPFLNALNLIRSSENLVYFARQGQHILEQDEQ